MNNILINFLAIFVSYNFPHLINILKQTSQLTKVPIETNIMSKRVDKELRMSADIPCSLPRFTCFGLDYLIDSGENLKKIPIQ